MIFRMSLPRGIEPMLCPTVPPVIILEGARMVGKTVVAQRLVESGHYQGYENLASLATRRIARADLAGWLSSLPDQVVIDEAQFLADLPLQIKFLVDQPHSPRRFLLTGSAALGRTGLNGSDPLTGRATRRRLWPFTYLELTERADRMAALVDDLFSGEVTTVREYQSFDAARVLGAGGFAPIALTAVDTATADRWVRDTTLGVLTEHVLPDERFDAGTAMRVLDGCYREPCGVLNLAALGQRLEVNPRTVDRYLDVLERRFLLHFLPNLAQGPARQHRTRAKVVPVDTAFASESVRRSDPAKVNDPRMIGKLLEAWVANQIAACLGVSQRLVTMHYWRDTKKDKDKKPENRHNEVDLVLVDSQGHAIGIETKLSSTATLSSAGGLAALNAVRELDFGYVIYTGTKTVRLSERIYALPIGALSSQGANS